MQKRSVMWDNKSVQMVQLPTLEECKTAFRQHMADPKWSFQCEAAGATDAGDGNETPEKETDPTGNKIPTARTKEEIAQAEWDALITSLRD